MASNRSSAVVVQPMTTPGAGTNATGSTSGTEVRLKSVGDRKPLPAQSPVAQRGIRRVERTQSSIMSAKQMADTAQAATPFKNNIRDLIMNGLKSAPNMDELLKRLAGASANAEANARAAVEEAIDKLGISVLYGARNLSELEDSLSNKGILPSGKGMFEDVIRGGIHVGGNYVPTWAVLIAWALVRGSAYSFVDNAINGPDAAMTLTEAFVKRGTQFLKTEIRAVAGDDKAKIKENLIFRTDVKVVELDYIVSAQGVYSLYSRHECVCSHPGAVWFKPAKLADATQYPTANTDIGTLYRVVASSCLADAAELKSLVSDSNKDFTLPLPSTESTVDALIPPAVKSELGDDYTILDSVAEYEITANGETLVRRRVRAAIGYVYWYQVMGRIVAAPDLRTIVETFLPVGIAALNKGAGFASTFLMPLTARFAGFRTSPLFTADDATLAAQLKTAFGLDNA